MSLEDIQRSLLADTVSQPKQQIKKADTIPPPRIRDQEPTREQQETLAACARIFLGAYDNPEKDFRIAIVQGSETGSFGSVKRFGIEAVKKDFSHHHPNKSVSEHIVMIGDMDSDIDRQFAGNVVDAFARNGDKNALLAKPYPADEIKKEMALFLLKEIDSSLLLFQRCLWI